MRRIFVAAVTIWAFAVGIDRGVLACTGFCAAGAGQVLVGNNEDWNNPRTRIWFVAAKPGSFGRMYVGFDDLRPQGGMNERGLWFDGFATPPVASQGPSDLPRFPGDILDAAMAQCATVEEVVRLFSQYDRSFLVEGTLMFADAGGDAAAIERNAIVRKSGAYFVQTNFHQSRENGRDDGRFTTASDMLERAHGRISVELFRDILAATHQKGPVQTLYSNVYDLRARTMYLYYFHDFARAVKFDLAEELEKGERVVEIPSLFPPNEAAEAFASRRKTGGSPGGSVVIAFLVIPLVVVGLSVYGGIRGGRGIRTGLALCTATIVLITVSSAVMLRMHQPAADSWMEFSIGPESGDSASVQPSMIRSTGITLKGALAAAYDIPAVRIVGPSWLAGTRYSINAVVDADASDSFRSLLRQELQRRLRLQTHYEVRPFDVFVLTAAGAPRLERSPGKKLSVWVEKQQAHIRDASMSDLASALQLILGKPVIDETGIGGTYNLELAWGENRIESVAATLREAGLELSPGGRDMEVLVIDSIRRDPALLLLTQIGRATRIAPQAVRQQITDALRIR